MSVVAEMQASASRLLWDLAKACGSNSPAEFAIKAPLLFAIGEDLARESPLDSEGLCCHFCGGDVVEGETVRRLAIELESHEPTCLWRRAVEVTR